MTSEQIILFSLFGAVFALLLWGRLRYDLIAFSALMAGVVLGVVPTESAFSGFGHPATIVVALVGRGVPYYPHAGRQFAQPGQPYRIDGRHRRGAIGVHE